MLNIRHCAFETNSSSSHSLTIAGDDLLDLSFDASAYRAGVISLMVNADADGYTIDFGGEWKRFYRPENKLLYVLIAAAGGEISANSNEGDILPSVIEALKSSEKKSDKKSIVLVEKLLAWVLAETGCTVELRFAPDVHTESQYVMIEYNYGSLVLPLLDDADKLRQFMFSRNSYLQTGRDNGIPPFEIETDDRGDEAYFAKKMVDADDLSCGFNLSWDKAKKTVMYVDENTTVVYGPVSFGSELFNPLYLKGVSRLHLLEVAMSVPSYVTSWPEDMRDLDDELSVTRKEWTENLFNHVISCACVALEGSNESSILTVAPSLRPVVSEVGTCQTLPRTIFACHSAEMTMRCDRKTLHGVRRLVKKLAKEYAA